jgi:NADPH-dependent glutamate synthase beta subunit-like oxidoreductase
MYARDYGDLELAREAYASLGAGASPCLGCTATPCANACAFGVEIPTLTREAHARLAAAPAR